MSSTPAFLKTDPSTFLNSEFLSFTRASVATRVNAAGLIETVPVDTMRLDDDPITLAQKGLLIEEARSNSIFRSNEFTNSTWGKFNRRICNQRKC